MHACFKRDYVTEKFRIIYIKKVSVSTLCNICCVLFTKSGIDVVYIMHERVRNICVGDSNETLV